MYKTERSYTKQGDLLLLEFAPKRHPPLLTPIDDHCKRETERVNMTK